MALFRSFQNLLEAFEGGNPSCLCQCFSLALSSLLCKEHDALASVYSADFREVFDVFLSVQDHSRTGASLGGLSNFSISIYLPCTVRFVELWLSERNSVSQQTYALGQSGLTLGKACDYNWRSYNPR